VNVFPPSLAPAELAHERSYDAGWFFERTLDGEVVAFEGSRSSFSALGTRIHATNADRAGCTEWTTAGHPRHPGLRRHEAPTDLTRVS
jgi:hypothetical protein